MSSRARSCGVQPVQRPYVPKKSHACTYFRSYAIERCVFQMLLTREDVHKAFDFIQVRPTTQLPCCGVLSHSVPITRRTPWKVVAASSFSCQQTWTASRVCAYSRTSFALRTFSTLSRRCVDYPGDDETLWHVTTSTCADRFAPMLM